MPAALLEALAPYLEDLLVAEGVRSRLAADDATRLSLAELVKRNGWSADEIKRDAAEMRRELGLG